MQNESVKQQYATDKNLNTRISIHDKYSVNKKGFGNWIFEQYELNPGMRILELGCGNASMWVQKTEMLPQGCELILTDFSEGMLDAAKKNLGERERVRFRQVDIASIPYENNEFDMVIANMMLYHVPDINATLAEVKRVLKPEGRFYCATYGEHGLVEYLENLFADYGIEHRLNTRFTLQNGAKYLHEQFSSVERMDYEDAFEVTDSGDMLAYMRSMTSMADYHMIDDAVIIKRLEEKRVNGSIHIPKEYGMFIAGD